jgi:DNA invertase Pin-like site-specific DNA recombinase
MKKVIELIRVSTERQADDDRASIPAQRAINRRTALAHGLEIETIIEITDVSGAAVMHAPEMHRLIELLRTRRYHGVVAREFSRLMRPENFYDMGLLQEFVNAKAMLYLPDGPIDFSSKSGRLMGTIRAAMAGAERTELLERSWGAKEEMRKEGKCPSGHITWPYGVAYDRSLKGKGWHYTHDAEKVRQAFKLFISGETSFSVIASKTGLSRTALPTILTNPIYKGWRVYNSRRDQAADAKRLCAGGRQGDRRKMQRAPEDVISVQVIHTPLISDQTFATAQRILEVKKARHWRHRPGGISLPRFTYSGFMVCAECQHSVYTQSGRTIKNRTTGEIATYDYYFCSQSKKRNCRTSYMDRSRLEGKLDDLFSERLTDRGYISELAQEFMRRAKNKNGRAIIARLQQTINTLRERRERVIESVIDGLIGREDGKSRTEAIDRDILAAQDALLREAPGSREITPDQLAYVLSGLFNWKFLERNHKRLFLAARVPEIHVADYKIHGIGVLNASAGLGTIAAVQTMEDFGDYESHRKTAY